MANEYVQKDYTGGMPDTTLNGAISSNTTTITVTASTGMPDGSQGAFVLAIDRGTATEEKILVESRSGVTLTVLERGYDDTTAQAHADLAEVTHVWDANSALQANAMATAMTTTGDLVRRGAGGLASFEPIHIGTDGWVLLVSSGLPAYGQVSTAGILDAAVTAAKLATDAVTTAKILDANVTTTKLVDLAVTAAKLAADAVTTAKILDSAVTTAKLANSAVTNAKVDAAAAIAASKLLGVMLSSTGANRTITVSDTAATGTPADGDIWIEY